MKTEFFKVSLSVLISLLSVNALMAEEIYQVLPIDFKTWSVLTGDANSIAVEQVEVSGDSWSLAYDSPDRKPFRLVPDEPLELPAEAKRICFWLHKSSGDVELTCLISDASGQQHEVRMLSQDPKAEDYPDIDLWSGWRWMQSIYFGQPTEDEVAMRTIPEYREQVDSLLWKAPLKLEAIIVKPATQRVFVFFEEGERPLVLNKMNRDIREGRGGFTLRAPEAKLKDGLDTEYRWYLRDRRRFGQDMPVMFFYDDLSRPDAPAKFSYEIIVRQGYQGPVVWYQQGEGLNERDNPNDIFSSQVDLPELPKGRYFITLKTFNRKHEWLYDQLLELYVTASPAQATKHDSTPFSLTTDVPDNVFPYTDRSAELTATIDLKAFPPGIVAESQLVITVISWKGEVIHEATYPLEEKQNIKVENLAEGTDYYATAQIINAQTPSIVYDQAYLHFGVKNDPNGGSDKPVSGLPTIKEHFDHKAHLTAEHLYISTSIEYPQMLNEDAYERFDDFCKVSKEHHMDAVSLRTLWGELEPLPGVYRWDLVQKQLDIAKEHDLEAYFGFHSYILATLHYPLWLDCDPMIDQWGNMYEKGYMNNSIWDDESQEKFFDFNEHLVREFNNSEQLVGYKLGLLSLSGQPFVSAGDYIRLDYSPSAQEAFKAWLEETGRAQTELSPMFTLPGIPVNELGPDLSDEWQNYNYFAIETLQHHAEGLINSYRKYDPERMIHYYRRSRSYCPEVLLPLLTDNGAFQDESGPMFRQLLMKSMADQGGVPMLGEMHPLWPSTKSVYDAQSFLSAYGGNYFDWNIRYRVDQLKEVPYASFPMVPKSFAKHYRKTKNKGLPEVWTYIQETFGNYQQYMTSSAVQPEILIVGSRIDGLLGGMYGKKGFFSDSSGLDVFLALTLLHHIPVHYANEYCDWVDFNAFKGVIVVGEIFPSKLVDKLDAFAQNGGKVALIGNAGSILLEDPESRNYLADVLADCDDVRAYPAMSEPVPEPGPVSWDVQFMFEQHELDEILDWFGYERQIDLTDSGFVCELRTKGDECYVAVLRRWPGWYKQGINIQENVDDYGKENVTVKLYGLDPAIDYTVEQFHNTPKELEYSNSGNAMTFGTSPMDLGEVQLFRIAPK